MTDGKELLRAGVTFSGPVTVNGPMFDIHDNARVELHVSGAEVKTEKDVKKSAPAEDEPLPPAFLSVKGEEIRARLEAAGLVDGAWQPTGLSITERGVLARFVSAELGIGTPWKTFARLWGMNADTLRSAFNKALDQRKTLAFQERLKGVV